MKELVNTIIEVKAYAAVSMTSDMNSLRPYLIRAQRNFVESVLGAQEFEVLHAAYMAAGQDTDNIADEKVQQLAELAQEAIINLGYMYGAAVLSIQIGDSGFQVVKNDNAESARQWQVREAVKSMAETGYSAVENMIDFAEKNPVTFPFYQQNPDRIARRAMWVNNAQTFALHYRTELPNLTWQSLGYIQQRVERMEVAPAIGKYHDVLKFVWTTASANELQKKLITQWLQPACVLLSLSKGLKERALTITVDGVKLYFDGATLNSAESKPAEAQRVNETAAHFATEGRRLLDDAIAWMIENEEGLPGYEPPALKRGFKIDNNRDRNIIGF